MKKRKIITYIIIIVIFFFIGKVLVQNWKQIPFENLKFNSIFLIYSFVSMAVSLLIGAFEWKLCIRCFGEEVSFLKANQILSLSRLAAYVPGKVWSILGIVYFAKQEGISGVKVGANVILETIIWLLSAFLITLVSFAFSPTPINLFLLLILIPLCLIALYPPLFRKMVNFGLKRLKQKIVGFSLHYSKLLGILAISLLNWFFQGLCFYFLIKSFYQIPLSLLAPAISSHAISWVIGFVSVFSPGGLGVKEGALGFFLKSYLPVSIGITSAILLRIWGIIGMLIYAGIFGRKYMALRKGTI